jgi:sulfur-oxidizing protein SoxZ
MTRALITVPKRVRRAEVFEIRAVIGHPMETGLRPDTSGKILPRNIIHRFECHYNDVLIFSADMFAALSANPYLAFHTVAFESGTLRFSWSGDGQFKHSESVPIEVL